MDHLHHYSVYSQMSMQYHILKLVLAVHAMSIHTTEIKKLFTSCSQNTALMVTHVFFRRENVMYAV